MQFFAIPLWEYQRAPWRTITHVRLVRGTRPDSLRALDSWHRLKGLADSNGVIELSRTIGAIEPHRRKDGDREKAIMFDLRYFSNLKSHGKTSLNKGWLELGYLKSSGS